MTQSEKLMQGIRFGTFRVDVEAFEKFASDLMVKFEQSKEVLATYGLTNHNSVKEKKTWLEALGCDCSRGCGKEVYENPVNLAAHPAELEALAKTQKLETLRRKVGTFRKALQDATLDF